MSSGISCNFLLSQLNQPSYMCCMQALGNHLSDILADEMADMSVIVEQVKEESRRKELRSNDEEEDYLDEGFAFS